MTDFQVVELGGLDQWGLHTGGFRPETTRAGRRVVDHELPMEYIGVTTNELAAGEEAGYWHTHSRVEELYLFLTGHGVLAVDDHDVAVGPGTAVRVGQDVWRTWRCESDSPEPLRWVCIRAGGEQLTRLPEDSERAEFRPEPSS